MNGMLGIRLRYGDLKERSWITQLSNGLESQPITLSLGGKYLFNSFKMLSTLKSPSTRLHTVKLFFVL